MRGAAVLAALVVGCTTPESVKQDIVQLGQEKAALAGSVENLRGESTRLNKAVGETQAMLDTLRQDQAVLAAEKDGRRVHYVLHCSIRQIHYSLSIKKQLADMVNEESFDLPTDKVSYEHAQPGSDLFDSFRAGSAIFKGSLGSWRIKVESKRTEVDPT